MFCFKCGSQQADEAKFCGACGTGLTEVVSPKADSSASAAPAAVQSPTTTPTEHDAPSADARLSIEEWAVTCTPPDDDGGVRFEVKVRADYSGSASAHLARLSWIAFDASGTLPLLQGDNTLTQDIDDEDSVEIEAGGYGKLGGDVAPDACRITGQVVLYPGEKQASWTIPLPEAGQTGGKGSAWPNADAEIVGWRLTCSENSEDSASYTLCLVIQNIGPNALAAVTFRVRVKNRKGDAWSTEFLTVERLAPAEMRSVEMCLYVSERAKARKGAVIELVGIVCSSEIVNATSPAAPALLEPETEPEQTDSDDESADEDHDEPVLEPALSDEPTEETVMAKKTAAKSVTWAPKAGKAATWGFYPSAKVRKDYPDCDRDHSGLDCQEGEVLSLSPQKTERRAKTLVVTIAEGRMELEDFDACWHEMKTSPDEDCTVWDIYRIVEDWSSD